MFRKVFSIILTLIFLVVVVAIGLHALHKDAQAQTIYKVYVWYDNAGVPTPVTNANIEFRFDDGAGYGDWLEPDSEGSGYYKITRDDWADA